MGEADLLERNKSGMAEVLAYRPAKAAIKLDKSRSWVYAEMASGTIKSVKVGGARLIPAAVIEQLLAGAK